MSHTMITLTDCFLASPDTTYEVTEGRAFVINMATSSYITLNHTGTFLWERLDGRSSLGVIAAEMAEAYGVDISIASSDVLLLANDLASDGYIVRAE